MWYNIILIIIVPVLFDAHGSPAFDVKRRYFTKSSSFISSDILISEIAKNSGVRYRRAVSTESFDESSLSQLDINSHKKTSEHVSNNNWSDTLPLEICPRLGHEARVYKNTFISVTNNQDKLTLKTPTSIEDCASQCCKAQSCDSAVYYQPVDTHQQASCIAVTCSSSQQCQPVHSEDSSKASFISSVIVLKNFDSSASEFSTSVKFHNDDSNSDTTQQVLSEKAKARSESLSLSEFIPQSCELYIPDQCHTNEECIGRGGKRRDGHCECVRGFSRNPQHHTCVKDDPALLTTQTIMPSPSPDFLQVTTTIPPITASHSTPFLLSKTTTPYTPKVLSVTVNNKTVTLPANSNIYEDKVTLSAYTLGGCEGCQYEWLVLQRPQTTGGEDAGSFAEPHSQTLELSRLLAGLYIFSVTVTKPAPDSESLLNGVRPGPIALGSTVANVTVIKAAKENKPPTVSVVPSSQTVTLPNSAVILDGSSSVDDFTENAKLEFSWEIVKGPIGYSLEKQTTQTLKLQNLLPGNYTIILRVKDEQGLEGNSTAFVEVNQEKDYPPSANAGGDQIVYLPQTETVLNGSLSSDDHKIIEWVWTKGEEDDGLAVDMQDTRTPLLKLSGLEVGHYQFILKVVDASNQFDTSVANVYVHTPDAAAIEAKAGPDLTITLPNTSVILDGSKSTGLIESSAKNWTQVSGPNTAHISPSVSELIVNVTGLTRGVYVFRLQLWSKDATKTSKDDVTVTVKQEQNQLPKANGGGDFSVTLPVSLVQVNGSASSDDVGIVKWRWERLPTSLAAGHVLAQSTSSAVLLLTGLVTGQYQWKLTVWDDQGASSSDTVSFIVKAGSHDRDQVAVVLGEGIENVSAAQLTNVLKELKIFLPSSISLIMVDYTGLPHTGESRIVMLGYDTSVDSSPGDIAGSSDASDTQFSALGAAATPHGSVVPGVQLASLLQAGVRAATAARGEQGGKLFELPIITVHTVICQNNCSGHGECDRVNRECLCYSWWMESYFRRHFGDTTPNCDWSVIYVFVASIASTTLCALLLWMCAIAYTKRRQRTTARQGNKGRKRCQSADSSNVECGSCMCLDTVLTVCCGCATAGSAPHGKRRESSRYSLLDEETIKLRARSSLLDSNTDSDSDTEVLFDTRSSTKNKLKLPDKQRNGLHKTSSNRLRT